MGAVDAEPHVRVGGGCALLCPCCQVSFDITVFWKHALFEIASRGNSVTPWQVVDRDNKPSWVVYHASGWRDPIYRPRDARGMCEIGQILGKLNLPHFIGSRLLVRVGRYVPILGERVYVLNMLSYTYKPARGTGQITPSESRTSDDTETDRFLEAMEDDVVTLDYMIGVTTINGEYAFVQNKPTEKHKRCAGTKISPVHQINMFIQTLRDNGVSLETAICTIAESNQRTLWLRIPLSELKELSLEPLSMIRGVVQLFGKQQCIAIAIDDRALANMTLDPDTALLVDLCARGQTEQTHRDEEPTQQQKPKGSWCSSPTETRRRKRTLASQDTDSVTVCKKPKPLCYDTPIHGNKQHR